MIRDVTTWLTERLRRGRVELEVDQELRFHLEMLERDFVRQGMSAEMAISASRERFGDIERIRRQCMQINRRKVRVVRALKSALILMLITGLLLRLVGNVPQFWRIGDLSILIAVFGHLLLHARALLPSRSPFAKRNTFGIG